MRKRRVREGLLGRPKKVGSKVASGSVHVDSAGRSGGLMLLWSKDWEVELKSFTSGHIDSFFKAPEGD